jgi:putative ABC transport system permease protein
VWPNLAGSNWGGLRLEGFHGTQDDVSFDVNRVGPDYFSTLGVRLLEGRGLDSRDRGTLAVAVINETMARRYWPAGDALGRKIYLDSTRFIEVVGVARDGKYMMLIEPRRPYFYIPIEQSYRSPVTLLVRSAGDPAPLAGPLQRLLNEMDPDLPVFNVRTMAHHMRDSVFGFMPFRLAVLMAGVQGAIGLLLAVMGLYAVVAYTVTRRTREIGLRMALGANRADVLRLVVRDGMRLTLIGVVLGLLLAVGIGLVLSQVLYGLSPVDVPVLAGVTALLLGVSALACYVPARRATRVDPMIALRCE